MDLSGLDDAKKVEIRTEPTGGYRISVYPKEGGLFEYPGVVLSVAARIYHQCQGLSITVNLSGNLSGKDFPEPGIGGLARRLAARLRR